MRRGEEVLDVRRCPPRPPHCTYASICELYEEFDRIFLQSEQVDSASGQAIRIYDHHFFHMAGIQVKGRKRLFMAQEKEVILATKEGFGHFEVLYGGSRAKNLPSAYATIIEPDEVWEDNPRCTNAKWVYIKQFDSAPYPYTVALLTLRQQEKIVVPVSSFPCKKKRHQEMAKGNKNLFETRSAALRRLSWLRCGDFTHILFCTLGCYIYRRGASKFLKTEHPFQGFQIDFPRCASITR